MTVVVKLFTGHGFLGSRATAHEIMGRVEEALSSDPSAEVVLDFGQIIGVAHSFSDELLSPLADMLGEKVPQYVSIANCSAEVAEELESVAAMHGLPMPRFREFA